MPKCVYCGAETDLHIKGKPICVKCDDLTDRERTVDESKDDNQEPRDPPSTSF